MKPGNWGTGELGIGGSEGSRGPLGPARAGFVLLMLACTIFSWAASTRASGAQPSAGQDQNPSAFRATTDLVSIYVTATDKSGRLVTDLARDDFEVRDNGKVQPLAMFSNDVQPFAAVVMLDCSGSMADEIDTVRQGASAFVSKLLPKDRARIGSFSREVRIAPEAFTSDHDALNRVLASDLQGLGPSPVWTAVDRSITALLPLTGRRVVLLFSDGHDDPARGQIKTDVKDVMWRSQVDGIMVYAIGFATEGSWPSSSGRSIFQPGAGPFRGHAGPTSNASSKTEPPDRSLRKLAEESGGGYFEMDETHDLSATFSQVAEELHRQYWLGFAPRALDGKVHSIEIRVKRSDVTVRARKSYVAQ
jgi:Ca-activated chloride channel family protein